MSAEDQTDRQSAVSKLGLRCIHGGPMEIFELKPFLEAMLMAADRPVTLQALAVALLLTMGISPLLGANYGNMSY